MAEITLKKYIENGGTQAEVADALECSQPAVSYMLAGDRDIRLVLNKKGAIVDHYEIKKRKRA